MLTFRRRLRKVLWVTPISSHALEPTGRTLSQRGLVAVLGAVALAVAGCGAAHPRTVVLRATAPVMSDIYLRITGPGEAVSYTAQVFRRGGAFDRFNFRETPRNEGVFLPPPVRERKLCASTHVIQPGDAPQLQKWRGKTLAITIYGKKVSRIYCSVLTGSLYLGAS
jgi:hypothetical protein